MRSSAAAVNSSSPIAFVDVHYEEPRARAACVYATAWTDAESFAEWTVELDHVMPYEPGRFFERELPCLTAVLARAPEPPSTVVVDGYVILDRAGAPGLGAHLFEHFGGRIPVVGIAKHAFRGSDFAVAVQRGDSERPLFVTARGMPAETAAQLVATMHGEHRIPTLCTRVDHLARGLTAPK
jgi:deoxyribonuclease V